MLFVSLTCVQNPRGVGHKTSVVPLTQRHSRKLHNVTTFEVIFSCLIKHSIIVAILLINNNIWHLLSNTECRFLFHCCLLVKKHRNKKMRVNNNSLVRASSLFWRALNRAFSSVRKTVKYPNLVISSNQKCKKYLIGSSRTCTCSITLLVSNLTFE
jgi:hypothetical protein